MAKVKKAKKMIKVHEKKRVRNLRIKSEVKTRVKSVVAGRDLSLQKENFQELVRLAVKRADQAANKRIIHKNKAARIKSRLMKKMNKAAA